LPSHRGPDGSRALEWPRSSEQAPRGLAVRLPMTPCPVPDAGSPRSNAPAVGSPATSPGRGPGRFLLCGRRVSATAPPPDDFRTTPREVRGGEDHRPVVPPRPAERRTCRETSSCVRPERRPLRHEDCSRRDGPSGALAFAFRDPLAFPPSLRRDCTLGAYRARQPAPTPPVTEAAAARAPVGSACQRRTP